MPLCSTALTARSSAPSAALASPPARAASISIASSSIAGGAGMPRSASLSAPRSSRLDLRGAERLQLVELTAGDQRRVDLEVGVLGRRPDQGDQAVLDRRQQRVLLGLVEAVDLVEEEDGRAPARLAALARPGDHRSDLGTTGVDGRLLLDRPAGGVGDDPSDRRLAGARRTVQDHRVRPGGLDRGAQGRARGEQMLLADQVLERSGPHPHGERRGGIEALRLAGLGVEQGAVAHRPAGSLIPGVSAAAGTTPSRTPALLA